MKKALFLILIFVTSKVNSQTLVLGALNTAVSQKNILIIMFGESNSGGLASNSDATLTELSNRGRVQLWNNTSNTGFYNLEIPVNSRVGHDMLTNDGLRHGLELQLANKVYENSFSTDTVYLVKAGQGGSYIGSWINGGTYWNTWKTRVNGAISNLTAKGKPIYIYVMYSQGINDAAANANADTWGTATLELINRTRTEIGNVTFYVTNIPRNNIYYNAIDDKINTLANQYNYIIPIQTSDAAIYSDNMHWTYAGLKLICDRMLNYIIPIYNTK